MLFYALKAAKELDEEGIQTEVINIASIKPLDKQVVLDSAKKTGATVSVEDHQVAGGLGGMLAEVFAEHMPTPLERVGLQDTFGESGKPEELLTKFNMDTNSIKKAVEKVISRKKA